MKIGLVCPYDLAKHGGVQEQVLLLRDWLDAEGHDVTVVGPASEPVDGVVAVGGSVTVRSVPGRTEFMVRTLNEYSNLEQIRDTIVARLEGRDVRVRECRPDEIGMSVSYPLPGTRFYEMVREELGSKQNWVDSEDLDMMFVGTYTTAFYRQLYVVLHKEFRARRSMRRLLGAMRAPTRPAPSRRLSGTNRPSHFTIAV